MCTGHTLGLISDQAVYNHCHVLLSNETAGAENGPYLPSLEATDDREAFGRFDKSKQQFCSSDAPNETSTKLIAGDPRAARANANIGGGVTAAPRFVIRLMVGFAAEDTSLTLTVKVQFIIPPIHFSIV